jgi:hypothetical protein
MPIPELLIESTYRIAYKENQMLCTNCNKKNVIEIRMTVGGESLAFHRCGSCDAKAWTSGEATIELGRVLDLARPARV